MSFLVLCFSLWGLISGLADSSLQAPFLCIFLVLFIRSGAVDGCSGACVAARGRGKMWVRLEAAPSAQAFVGSPPSPVPHLCSCSEGDSWADYCGCAGLSVAGVSRTPRMTVWRFRSTFLQGRAMVLHCHLAGICGRSWFNWSGWWQDDKKVIKFPMAELCWPAHPKTGFLLL